MKSVRGHFDGNVVVLDEPAPTGGEVDVIVQFPDVPVEPQKDELGRTWHWGEARRITAGLGSAVSDELRRQRDGE